MHARDENSCCTGIRALGRCGLLAVPALALIAAGPALSSAFNGGSETTPKVETIPAEAVVVGDTSAKPADPTSIWQNTTRVPYIPGPRSPYIPPGP
jgi:hypothetical protein